MTRRKYLPPPPPVHWRERQRLRQKGLDEYNALYDKIGEHGYESLTKHEKGEWEGWRD